jgi:hypothetical protein
MKIRATQANIPLPREPEPPPFVEGEYVLRITSVEERQRASRQGDPPLYAVYSCAVERAPREELVGRRLLDFIPVTRPGIHIELFTACLGASRVYELLSEENYLDTDLVVGARYLARVKIQEGYTMVCARSAAPPSAGPYRSAG